MKAILHIGALDTAASLIQGFLYDNRGKLKGQGYVGFDAFGDMNAKALANYARSVTGDTSITDPDALVAPEKVAAFFGGLDEGINTVVISHEGFWSLSEAEVAALKALLDSFVQEYEVIAYLPRQDVRAVKRHWSSADGYMLTGATIDLSTQKPENYYKRLERWAAAFGDEAIKPRSFEAEKLRNGNVLVDFSHACGIKLKDTFALPDLDMSGLNRDGLDFVRALRSAAARMDGQPKAAEIRNDLIRTAKMLFPGDGYLPARSEAEAFYENVRVTNNKLAQRWMGRKSLFSTEFDEYPASREVPDLSPQRINDILSKVGTQYFKVPNFAGSQVHQDILKSSRSFDDAVTNFFNFAIRHTAQANA